MTTLAHKVGRKLTTLWTNRRERFQLGKLYSPDPGILDPVIHLREAMEWLKRAQDAGNDRGVSYGVPFGKEFADSYPETTGYICQTFVEQERLTGEAELLERAIEMADWELSIQLPTGAVMGGIVNTNPSPAVFNTGMVLLGWASVFQRTGAERFAIAARHASEWLVSVQEVDGRWVRGNSQFAAAETTLYNVKAAWGLCEAGMVTHEPRFVEAAVRNAEYCVSRQWPNGWLPDCCLSDPTAPLLHTLAYSMQGLIGIAKLTDREDFVAAARLLADAQLRVMRADGYLPGRQRSDFSDAAGYSCLTGSAQVSIVCSELHQLTGDPKYAEAARRINRYLMARHDIRNHDLRLRGGVPGSWPVWGDYGRLQILNWATKFFVDAISMELRTAS